MCSRTHLHVLTSTYKYLYVYLRVIPPPLFIQFVIQQHKSLVLRQPPLVCVAEPIYTYLQVLTSTSMHTHKYFYPYSQVLLLVLTNTSTCTYVYFYAYLRVVPPPLFIQFVIQQDESLVLCQPPLVCVAEPVVALSR